MLSLNVISKCYLPTFPYPMAVSLHDPLPTAQLGGHISITSFINMTQLVYYMCLAFICSIICGTVRRISHLGVSKGWA